MRDWFLMEANRLVGYHLGALQREAEDLVEIGSNAGESSLGERLVEFGRTVARESDEQLQQLERTRFGSFGLIHVLALPALLVGLGTVLYYEPAAISGVSAGVPHALVIAVGPFVLDS